MNILNNIKKDKVTTGTGLAMAVLLALRAFKIDVGQVVGMNTTDLAFNLGSVVSAVILLFARDPKEKTVNK